MHALNGRFLHWRAKSPITSPITRLCTREYLLCYGNQSHICVWLVFMFIIPFSYIYHSYHCCMSDKINRFISLEITYSCIHIFVSSELTVASQNNFSCKLNVVFNDHNEIDYSFINSVEISILTTK